MEDTPVVNLTEFREAKKKKEELALKELFDADKPRELEDIYDASDEVLDVLEQNFDEGVCVGLLDGMIQVSSTVDDIDTIIYMLEEALYNIRNDY